MTLRLEPRPRGSTVQEASTWFEGPTPKAQLELGK